MQLVKYLSIFILIFNSPFVLANSVKDVLALENKPAGVVFEIVSGDPQLLDELIPELKKDIEKLRQRFPNLPVAIVAHGREQFGLMSKYRSKESIAHNMVEEMVNKNKVDVHVCGTHAEWYGVTPEDFPDYVDVSAVGPVQINDYVDLGYELIVLP